MPTRAPFVCGHCGKTHLTGAECRLVAARDKARKARHDERRPSARQRGYTAEWERESKAFLASHPFCRVCGEPASVVDHIIPHKGDMRVFWDRANWQPLCAHHHNSAKQSRDRRSSRME